MASPNIEAGGISLLKKSQDNRVPVGLNPVVVDRQVKGTPPMPKAPEDLADWRDLQPPTCPMPELCSFIPSH
jgi:hypothetical protein